MWSRPCDGLVAYAAQLSLSRFVPIDFPQLKNVDFIQWTVYDDV